VAALTVLVEVVVGEVAVVAAAVELVAGLLVVVVVEELVVELLLPQPATSAPQRSGTMSSECRVAIIGPPWSWREPLAAVGPDWRSCDWTKAIRACGRCTCTGRPARSRRAGLAASAALAS